MANNNPETNKVLDASTNVGGLGDPDVNNCIVFCVPGTPLRNNDQLSLSIKLCINKSISPEALGNPVCPIINKSIFAEVVVSAFKNKFHVSNVSAMPEVTLKNKLVLKSAGDSLGSPIVFKDKSIASSLKEIMPVAVVPRVNRNISSSVVSTGIPLRNAVNDICTPELAINRSIPPDTGVGTFMKRSNSPDTGPPRLMTIFNVPSAPEGLKPASVIEPVIGIGPLVNKSIPDSIGTGPTVKRSRSDVMGTGPTINKSISDIIGVGPLMNRSMPDDAGVGVKINKSSELLIKGVYKRDTPSGLPKGNKPEDSATTS